MAAEAPLEAFNIPKGALEGEQLAAGLKMVQDSYPDRGGCRPWVPGRPRCGGGIYNGGGGGGGTGDQPSSWPPGGPEAGPPDATLLSHEGYDPKTKKWHFND